MDLDSLRVLAGTMDMAVVPQGWYNMLYFCFVGFIVFSVIAAITLLSDRL